MLCHTLKLRVSYVCLLLLTCAAYAPARVMRPALIPRTVQASQVQQERMEELARRHNLGARRADSAHPQPTTSSGYDRVEINGYYQCFERGCVYDSLAMVAVAGVIFTKFVAEGYERGPLGFPTSSEQACVQPAGSRYQMFQGGRIVLDGATGAAMTYRTPTTVGDGGDCRSPSARLAARANESARFRVTLNGFTVNRQTFDHALDVDGKSDEIFFLNKVALYRKDAQQQQGRAGVRYAPVLASRIMGDVNGHAGRVRAGSASALGGLRTGDRFPSDEPWIRAGNPKADVLPMLLWEGELVKGESWVIVVLTIWEWDNGDQRLRAAWSSNSEYWLALRDFDPELPTVSTPLVQPLPLGLGMSRTAAWHAFGTAEDRPVGLKKDRRGSENFDPTWLVLSFENATRAVSEAQSNKGVGIVEINYADSDEFNGDYTVYLQVERLP